MKGHKFDWRIKRRPPFCVFLAIGHGAFVVRQVRMHRRATPKRTPSVRWLGKRGTQRFVMWHCDHAHLPWPR